ncbi:MAG: hypothetical protein JKY95_12510, partial [Planctomycetaceae bacterium]|nr:hypothetical protein [Planctomycetaceae bacterium]
MPNSRDIILRIDRVGSFRLILSDQIILGGPAARQEQGVVRILAPLSSSHARIRRHAGGYSIEPLRGSVQLGSQVETSANNESRLLIEETYWGNKTQAMLSPEIGANL